MKEATLYAKKDGVVKKVSSLHVKEGEVKELHARSWVWKKTGNGPGGLTYMHYVKNECGII